MNLKTIIYTFITLTLWTFQVKADTWFDPDWKEMIDKSDLIALVEYTSEGEYRAKAKPLKFYKGKLKTNHIWIWKECTKNKTNKLINLNISFGIF